MQYKKGYALGKDMSYLTDKNLVRFWDIDGVLCVYGFGSDGIQACDDACFQDFIKEHDIYAEASPIPFIHEFMERYTVCAHNYIVSRVESDYEEERKRAFVDKYYGKYISQDHIFFVRDDNKSDVIKHVLNTCYAGVEETRHCIIDDTVGVLDRVQKDGLSGVHISSLLLFARLG